MIDRSITYNRETKDFDCFVDSRYVGSRPNYRAGDELCNEIAYDLAEQGLIDTLPTDVFCSTCDGEGRIPAYGTGDQAGGYAETCPDCDGRPREISGAELTTILREINAYVAPPESLRADCLAVITMALGHTNGASSVVNELRRVKARLEAAALT